MANGFFSSAKLQLLIWAILKPIAVYTREFVCTDSCFLWGSVYYLRGDFCILLYIRSFYRHMLQPYRTYMMWFIAESSNENMGILKSAPSNEFTSSSITSRVCSYYTAYMVCPSRSLRFGADTRQRTSRAFSTEIAVAARASCDGSASVHIKVKKYSVCADAFMMGLFERFVMHFDFSLQIYSTRLLVFYCVCVFFYLLRAQYELSISVLER